MRPVDITDFPRGRVTQDTLLLLNTSRLGLRYAKQLLTRDHNPDITIRSKGGKTLPNEIWTKILKFTRERTKGIDDQFCLVKAEIVTTSPTTTLLRCFRHEFNHSGYQLLTGCIESSLCVSEFEDYLAAATPAVAETLEVEVPELRRLSGPDNTFDVVLDTTSTGRCLYTDLEVPDLIARLEDGDCWVCSGNKFICPGCTGGIAQEFQVFMSCGVDLACPLCIGVEFSQNHKNFLDHNLWNERLLEDEKRYMLELVEDRLEELGYANVQVPDGAWYGTNGKESDEEGSYEEESDEEGGDKDRGDEEGGDKEGGDENHIV
ncbi:hypothetical protein GGR54DRAFT_620403 [Hypoxylon sp. NC1633]|nr:hypothetical protein GGR54DRAFT_620403 [Hypoxylon sp. NC1633]